MAARQQSSSARSSSRLRSDQLASDLRVARGPRDVAEPVFCAASSRCRGAPRSNVAGRSLRNHRSKSARMPLKDPGTANDGTPRRALVRGRPGTLITTVGSRRSAFACRAAPGGRPTGGGGGGVVALGSGRAAEAGLSNVWERGNAGAPSNASPVERSAPGSSASIPATNACRTSSSGRQNTTSWSTVGLWTWSARLARISRAECSGEKRPAPVARAGMAIRRIASDSQRRKRFSPARRSVRSVGMIPWAQSTVAAWRM